MNYRVTNASPDALVVKVKGGLSYLIKASKEATIMQEHLLYVSVPNIYLDSIEIREDQALTKLDRRILSELSKEYDTQKKSELGYYSGLTTSLETKIVLGSSLIEDNNAIHSELLGITLYLGANNFRQPALNTPTMTLKELFDKNSEDEMQCLSYIVYVNDPKRVSSPYWTNVKGISTPIPTVSNLSKQPGLYVAISRGITPREELYYAFEELNTKLVEGLGIFESKAACDKGGNTERYASAEEKVKELSKDKGKLLEQVKTLGERVVNLEEQLGRASDENTRLKYEHKTELGQLKHTHQMNSEMSKFENRLTTTVSKANFDLVKHKASQNTWTDFAKAVGTLAGVAFTGYKLLTT